MTFLSLFAGIGGFDLGLERAGHECIGQVEIDPFCTRVLERRWPSIRRWGDVRSVDCGGSGLSPSRPSVVLEQSGGGRWYVDLLVGGFPCQDLSVAGKRAGLQGSRSGLFWEIARIAKEVQPPWGLFENVPGLVSSNHGRDMWAVLQGLRECWPAVGWRILDSQHFGVPQRRRRVFFVCGPTEARVAAVLFESEGGGGDIATGKEAGTGVAPAITCGFDSLGYSGRDESVIIHTLGGDRGGLDNGKTEKNLITCLRHLGSGGPDDNEAQGGHLVTHPLKAEGADASEDGTGRGVPVVAYTIHASNANVKVRHAFEDNQSRTLDGMSGPDKNQGGTAIVQNMGVRRLTPVECERLQGFPDHWTCLCDEEPCRCPDGPRYRALGNAVTVNVVEWIGKQLLKVVEARS